MKGNLGERGRSTVRNTVLAGSTAVSPTSHISLRLVKTHTDSFVNL